MEMMPKRNAAEEGNQDGLYEVVRYPRGMCARGTVGAISGNGVGRGCLFYRFRAPVRVKYGTCFGRRFPVYRVTVAGYGCLLL